MGTPYQKKSVDVSNHRFDADSQNSAASRLASMARGRHTTLKRREQRSQERERLALLGTRAAVFAHEVASPLSGISVGLELVKRALEAGNADIHFLLANLETTILEIDRLASLLNEFRDFARPQNTEFQKIDLVKNTREVLSSQYDVYRRLAITVELQFDSPLLPVMGDADKIKQIVLNLCNNAVEAMPDGGYLTVKGYHFAGMVILEISDTGSGIPEGVDVFELFRTTKRDGSGLGLALVRQIVLAHNGTINYTSEPGRGTTFKLYLPAIDCKSELP